MKLKVSVNGVGHGEVMLGGLDISQHVRGLTINCGAGELSKAELHLSGIEAEVDGLVDVTNMADLCRRFERKE